MAIDFVTIKTNKPPSAYINASRFDGLLAREIEMLSIFRSNHLRLMSRDSRSFHETDCKKINDTDCGNITQEFARLSKLAKVYTAMTGDQIIDGCHASFTGRYMYQVGRVAISVVRAAVHYEHTHSNETCIGSCVVVVGWARNNFSI
jgi:hypothetical protein